MRRKGGLGHVVTAGVGRFHRDEGGQSLAIILALVTILFLMGSALATHASVALRSTVANEDQAGDLHGADAGAELGMWWQRNGNAGNPPAITVNGLTVNTTVTIAGGVPCITRTPVDVTGFEHGSISTSGGGIFSAVTGTGLSADATVRRTGNYSLKVIGTGGEDNNASLTIGTAAPGVAVVRVFLRLASDPTADVNELLLLETGGNDLRLGYQASSDRLTLRFANATTTVASSAVIAGTWYRIDLRLVANINPHTAAWQIDGTAQTAVTDVAGAATTVPVLRFGSTITADRFTANYDDVLISQTSGDYPIGDGTVVGLRPDAMGTSSGTGSFSEQDGSAIDANSWDRLNDNPMTSGADYVRQTVSGSGSDYVEVTFSDTSESCLVGVSGLVLYDAAATFGTNLAKTSIFDGATERVVYQGDMSTTTLTYRSAIVAPATAPWTPTAVNGLKARIGYSTDANPDPYWDALLLEVATGPPAVAGTVTVISTAGNSTVTTTYKDAGSASPTLLTWTTTK